MFVLAGNYVSLDVRCVPPLWLAYIGDPSDSGTVCKFLPVACVAGGLCRVTMKGRGAGEISVFPLQNLSPLPSITFSLFLHLSSAKIQYGAQTDVSPESARTTSYAGYSPRGSVSLMLALLRSQLYCRLYFGQRVTFLSV